MSQTRIDPHPARNLAEARLRELPGQRSMVSLLRGHPRPGAALEELARVVAQHLQVVAETAADEGSDVADRRVYLEAARALWFETASAVEHHLDELERRLG